MNGTPWTASAVVRQLVDRVASLALEVRERLGALAEQGQASPWTTTEEAAAWLRVSGDALDEDAGSHGHVDGGPMNVGEKRKTPCWHRDTLDEWFRRAAGFAAPKAKRRAAPAVKRGEGPRERFDGSTV